MSSKKPASGPKPGVKKAPAPGAKAGAAKPAAKGATKTGAKAPPKKEAAPPAPAPAPPKPITFEEMPVKRFNEEIVVHDKLKDCKKWATVIDMTGCGIVSTFLRHRDTNTISVLDKGDMEPETLRKGLLGAIKYGKPFILDMMDSEMWEECVKKFEEIQPGLMADVLSRKFCELEEYHKIYKEGVDGSEYRNMYEYRPDDFRFLVMTTCPAPSETLLRLTHPIKVV